MRQLHVQVREDKGDRVLELANEHDAFSPTVVPGERPGGERWSVVFLNLPNDQVGAFIWAVRKEVEDAQFVIFPWGTLPVQTPLSEVRQRVRNVSHLSALELVLSSLQSLGSWQGLLLYAFFSGIVAAYGLILNASFLLVAAMLIAPMGAPGMVAVIGTAIGDWKMVWRGTLRFWVAVAVLVATAAILGYAYNLGVSTALMEQVTALSAWTVLVALVAGAAGAQSQVQSERSSLVTATATGFLIAAALSPASAVIGLSIPLRRWDYAGLMGFVVLLQFLALIVGGSLSLLLYDVHPGDPTVGRGSKRGRMALGGTATLAVAGLVWWQIAQGPRWVKADVASDATALTRSAVRSLPTVQLIEASAHFTRPDLPDRSAEGLLVDVLVQRLSDTDSVAALESAVREAVEAQIRANLEGVIPFVSVTVFPPPPAR